MLQSFIAFIPLSNWLRGFDRYGQRYSKAGIAESTYPDATYMLREGDDWSPGLAKARRLISRLGRVGDRVVALRAQLPTGPRGMRPNEVTGTGIGWRWPSPDVPLSGVAWVDDAGGLTPTRHEEVTAQAFRLDGGADWAGWADCRPRSFSVLPVAKACQARCAFCFSKASVSELERQISCSLEHHLAWAALAVSRGAERAVITGGGEPTLLPPEALLALVRGLAARFTKTLLITNGARLSLASLREAGLTTLAISRHGATPDDDARIMGLRVDSAKVGREGAALGFRMRTICVLQRGGVDDAATLKAFLQRAADDGFAEVCFKELYVSSLSENPWAASAPNRFCEENQVPLRLVLGTLPALGFVQTGTLPWGSPIFEGELRGRRLKVAAYTEPSVGWERSHALVRSWNVMADGTCFASLEDPASRLELPTGEHR